MLVTVSGSSNFDEQLRLLKQVCDIAAENQVTKILVNGLALDGELDTLERYRVGAEVAAYIHQRQMNPRLAIVGKPPVADGFGVRVAQNRGIATEWFLTQQEGLNWLDKWSS